MLSLTPALRLGEAGVSAGIAGHGVANTVRKTPRHMPI
jgi:hypothetical protein